MPPKDWDKICRELSSGEDSDEHDSLNVRSVQKNARRVADMMQAMMPDGPGDFKGMRSPAPLRDGLTAAATRAASLLPHAAPAPCAPAADDPPAAAPAAGPAAAGAAAGPASEGGDAAADGAAAARPAAAGGSAAAD